MFASLWATTNFVDLRSGKLSLVLNDIVGFFTKFSKSLVLSLAIIGRCHASGSRVPLHGLQHS